jgi:hypothetical protein
MTDLRTSTPPATATLAGLIEGFRKEWDAYDGDNEVPAAIRAWKRTQRQIMGLPAATGADALAALSLLEEDMEVSRANYFDRALVEAIKGYIKSTAAVKKRSGRSRH